MAGFRQTTQKAEEQQKSRNRERERERKKKKQAERRERKQKKCIEETREDRKDTKQSYQRRPETLRDRVETQEHSKGPPNIHQEHSKFHWHSKNIPQRTPKNPTCSPKTRQLTGPKPKKIRVETSRINYLIRSPKVEKNGFEPVSQGRRFMGTQRGRERATWSHWCSKHTTFVLRLYYACTTRSPRRPLGLRVWGLGFRVWGLGFRV